MTERGRDQYLVALLLHRLFVTGALSTTPDNLIATGEDVVRDMPSLEDFKAWEAVGHEW